MTHSSASTSHLSRRNAGFVGSRLVEFFLLTIAACFLILHAVHLRADFPNHSPWMDWSKYTDEGWYGDAAIRHFQRGTWYVPGDFNPAAALPVWPLVELVVFRFTGVSVEAARALSVGIFGLILVSVYFLVRRWQNLASESGHTPSLAPAIAVLLLAVSPFCYAFSRLAILEPMLILLTLLALLAASYMGTERGSPVGWHDRLRDAVPVAFLGLLIPLMVLTKTTAVFLLPCIAWVLFARSGYRLRPFLKLGLPALILATVVWVAYYGLIVRPHFLSDYRYLFTANAYTGITSENAIQVLRETFIDGMWVGRILYPLALVAAVTALFFSRRLLRNPLVPALLLWAGGYAAFLAYHNNLQPRYYLVVAIPLTILAAIVFESLWNRRGLIAPLHHMTAVMSAVALAAVVVSDGRQTLGYVAHPEYTFADAADRIRQIVAADRTHNPLVLSISGSDLSLMTGVPSICDDFGTMDLAVRVKAYQPGWYVAWNQVDDDKMDALTPLYHLMRVASFPAMDDPERNLLILYRLDPATSSPVPRQRRAKPVPKLLQTSFGQQPNPIQLEH
jgi:hypothetical protein